MTTDSCIFCAIARGLTKAAVIFQDDDILAILDHRPLFLGHALLMPREHHETLVDLPPGLVQPLFARAQLLARAVQEGLDSDGTFIAINNRVSQSVPHLHVHVIPRRFGDGLKGFFWPRQRYADSDAIAETARAIGAVYARLRDSAPA